MALAVSRRAALALMAGAAAMPLPASATNNAPWRSLLPPRPAADGSIPGWRVLGGRAGFRLENGEIIGRSIEKSPNSFLCSEALFGDFILEFEVKTDPKLNTGMMIRALSRPDYRDGVVHGYQVEVDPSARRWTGGLYDEQRRLWLASPAHRPETMESFRARDWNRLRVEAIGPRIRTWLNGLPAANLVDDLTPRGFFGLQVHDVGPDPANAGLEVRFRDMRILTDDLARHVAPIDASDEQDYIANHLTAERRALGWRLLWEPNRQGWLALNMPGWSVEEGCIVARNATATPMTTESFSEFDLELDVQMEEGAEGHIGYLDNARYRLAQGPAGQGREATGTLVSRVVASNLTDPNPDKPSVKPAGLWNRVQIMVRKDRIQHWLNGSKLVDYRRDDPNIPAKGRISLGNRTGTIRFRSLRIRPL